jgi:hypothetical protein
MREEHITITVTRKGLQAYWLALNDRDLLINNGGVIVALPPGRYTLVWWMIGNPGELLSVAVHDARGAELARVKESKVPSDEIAGFGGLRFTVA